MIPIACKITNFSLYLLILKTISYIQIYEKENKLRIGYTSEGILGTFWYQVWQKYEDQRLSYIHDPPTGKMAYVKKLKISSWMDQMSFGRNWRKSSMKYIITKNRSMGVNTVLLLLSIFHRNSQAVKDTVALCKKATMKIQVAAKKWPWR